MGVFEYLVKSQIIIAVSVILTTSVSVAILKAAAVIDREWATLPAALALAAGLSAVASSVNALCQHMGMIAQ